MSASSPGPGASNNTPPLPASPPSRNVGSFATHSSRHRFKEFLEKRRRGELDQDADLKATGAAGPLPARDRSTKRNRTFWMLAREFWGLIAGHRALIGVCIGTVSLSAFAGLLMPASTKIALDYILTDHPGPSGLPAWVPTRDRLSLLWLLGGAMMAANLIATLVGTWGRWRMTRLAVQTRLVIRKLVFNHAVRLPLHRVYQIKSGGASSILRDDAGQAGDLLFSLLYNPWRSIVQLLGTLAILASVDWMLLVGAMVLIPAIWLSHRTWISRIRPVQKATRIVRQGLDAHTTESFGGMRVVRGFARERGEVGRFVRSNDLMSRQEIMVWWWSRFIEIAWMILLPAGSVAVLIYGGSRVVKGTLTIGDLTMFSAYVMMLLGPLEILTVSATNIQTQLAAFDRVLDILAEPTEFQAPPATLQADGKASILAAAGAALVRRNDGGAEVDRTTVRGRIDVRNVTFAYPGSTEPVLHGINLQAPAGGTVALVGPSGSGKTTLCNLVARFYDPTQGTIELDGVDLRTVNVESYRRLLGIVEQDVFLFDGTIRENIGFGRREASFVEMQAAAVSANADGFIRKLEHGYDTLIGERGVRLSGGQKQRLAIARAILADPRILILDEATSNLDTESEQLIQESLRTLMKGRTCFVIAHRLSTIRHADLIVVLENGRIIETGNHEKLAQREGRYWEMLRRQLYPGDMAGDAARRMVEAGERRKE
jgi:ATP-binding cassette subfamily B protein/subfamily B ATP-binding cassette protein MsbA